MKVPSGTSVDDAITEGGAMGCSDDEKTMGGADGATTVGTAIGANP